MLVLPEARLAPAGHVALPGRGERVDAAEVVAVGGRPAPALGVDVPVERSRVAGVDGQGGGTELQIAGSDLEADPFEGGADEVADVAAFVLDAGDHLELDRAAVDAPLAVAVAGSAGRGHLPLELAPGELGVVAEVLAADRLEDGQFVVVQRADVGVHRHGAALVDGIGDEVAIDQELHRLAQGGDAERVEVTFRGRGRVEDQGEGRRWRLDQADIGGVDERVGPCRLQTEEVEVHVVVLDVERSLILVEGRRR